MPRAAVEALEKVRRCQFQIRKDCAAPTPPCASGLLTKSVVEPSDSNLCLVTAYTLDPYGRQQTVTTRNCNGSAAVAPGAPTEAASPTGLAAFAGRQTSNTYTTDQRFVASTTNGLSQSENKTYSLDFGQLKTLQGPNQLTTTWSYDSLGRKTRETRADGTQTKFDYVYCTSAAQDNGMPAPPTGAATAVCNAVSSGSSLGSGTGTVMPIYYVQSTPLQTDGATPNGPYTRVYVDTLGREIRTETQGSDVSGSSRLIYQDTQYNSAGAVSAKSLPYYSGDSVYWKTFVIDQVGRVTSTTEPSTASTATTVTAYHGLTVAVTDPRGYTTTQIKNVAGQVATITDAKNGSLTRAYDPLGDLVQTTDALGNVVSMVFDIRGRKTAMYDPDMGVWGYVYNAAGDLVQQTDAKGQVTALSYDVLGRLTSRGEPNLTSTWSYDKYADGSSCSKGIGKLCEAKADNGYDRKVAYDGLGRPLSIATVLNSTTYAASIAYDVATSRVISQTYPTGLQITSGYTALGYLLKVVDARNSQELWRANSVDAQGNLLQQTYGNGVVTTNAYFPDGRINTIQAGAGNAVQNLTYGYEPNRNIAARLDVSTGVSASYTYDELNRLTSESRSGGALTATQVMGWTYDALGNMTSRAENGETNVYNYNSSGVGSTQPHAVGSIRIPVEQHDGTKPSPNAINHTRYNQLALQERDQYLKVNKIDPAKMTAEQAKGMLQHFKTEANPETRRFNQLQYSRALQQAMRRAWYETPIRGEE